MGLTIEWCQSTFFVISSDRMSDEDPFSYKPLRVTKMRKKMGRRRGKKADLDIKEGIVEISADTK